MLTLLAATTVVACDGNAPPQLLFKVPVHRLPRSMQQAYQNLPPGDSVELILPGEWFEPARELTVIDRAAADWSTPLTASEAAYSAFKRADDDWIVASFAKTDRTDIRGFLADSGVRAGSRRYFETVQGKLVHGWAEYHHDSVDYRLVFVSHRTRTSVKRIETFVLEDGHWRRTNRLAREREFQIAWNAYGSGRITPH